MELSVVIPCLNEEKTIKTCIEKSFEAFKKLNIEGEVIVSDNMSTDDSVLVAESLGAIIVKCEKKGYGCTLQKGINSARGKYILMADADNTYDFSQIPDFYNKIKENNNCKMVIGSRFKGKIEHYSMPLLNRYLGNPILTFLVNKKCKLKISDSQCGMRLFEKTSYDSIDFRTEGMVYATEQIVEFSKQKFSIEEIPINFYKDAEGRKPHLKPFKDGMVILKYLCKTSAQEKYNY